VRRSVSGETPTTNKFLSKDVTVKQVPLMLMLSPRWQSPRISEAEDIVSDVPPVSSCGLSSETAIMRQLSAEVRARIQDMRTPDYFYYTGEHLASLDLTSYHPTRRMYKASSRRKPA
jgi:hypothetical protein